MQPSDTLRPGPADDTQPCVPPTLPSLLEPPPISEVGWIIDLASEDLEDDLD